MMIDLHSHILPGIDDGSPDLSTSLEMARIALADGISTMVCTPHLKHGLYDTRSDVISKGVDTLQRALDDDGIALRMFAGADIHIAPDMVATLSNQPNYRLNASRYFLLELPQHVPPPRIETFVDELLAKGLIPIITHPERLVWADRHYAMLEAINDKGSLIQLTCGSLEGRFGETARKRALRWLQDGRVDVIASDAHNTTSRPPEMAAARNIVANLMGEEEARAVAYERPLQILRNVALVPRCSAERASMIDA